MSLHRQGRGRRLPRSERGQQPGLSPEEHQHLWFYVFMCLAVLSLCCCADFFLVAMSGGCSAVEVCGLLSLQSTGSRTRGLQLLQHVSSAVVAPWLVEPSRIRDQTYVSCVGRQILYSWATWEAQMKIIELKYTVMCMKKNSLETFKSGFEQAEVRIRKLEDRLLEIIEPR